MLYECCTATEISSHLLALRVSGPESAAQCGSSVACTSVWKRPTSSITMVWHNEGGSTALVMEVLSHGRTSSMDYNRQPAGSGDRRQSTGHSDTGSAGTRLYQLDPRRTGSRASSRT